MNEAIQQGTKCVKTLQDKNSQLKINMDNAESQHRSERARNLQDLENLIAKLAKKIRLEPVSAALSPVHAINSFQATQQMLASSMQQAQMSGFTAGALPAYNAGALPALNAGASPVYNAGALPAFTAGAWPAFTAGAWPAYPAGGYQPWRLRTPSMTLCRDFQRGQ